MRVAEAACAEGETIHNMPFPVNPEMVYNCLVGADALGKELKRGAVPESFCMRAK